MDETISAVEMTGMIDEHQQLLLDEPLPVCGPRRVRVILLYQLDEDWNETRWLQAAASSPAFADLGDPEEDMYSLADGKPFDDQI